MGLMMGRFAGILKKILKECQENSYPNYPPP
jgi:hypothetical protein